MIHYIRKAHLSKPIALTLAFFILGECMMPGVAFALTGGPSQPEVQSFQPVGTSDMVDPFSGDFSYNIPLMDVGGYPINLSYQSGITMDQEASWVGLGWNINPGVINRNMRGVPDDFDGEHVKKEFSMKSNQTYGVTWTPIEGELLGLNLTKLAKLNFGMGVTYNTYNGIGLQMSVSASITAMEGNKSSMNMGLGLSVGSESGVGVSPSLSFSKKMEDKNGRDTKVTSRLGLPYNSRSGLQTLTLSNSVDKQRMENKVVTTTTGADGKTTTTGSGGYAEGQSGLDATTVSNGGSSISFASASYTPKLNLPMLNSSVALSLSLGGEIFGGHPNTRFDGSYSGQFLLSKYKSTPAYGYLNMQNGQNLLDVMMDFNREKDGSFTENTPALPLSNLTYDVYSVSGQGIGGMYRPHRSELGYVFDNMVNNYSTALDLPAIEIGFGNAAHPGTNFSANFSITTTGKWEDDNQALPFLRFKGKRFNGDLPAYEPAYFKQAGEKTVDSDPTFFAKQGAFDAVRVAVYDRTSTTPAQPFFLKDDGAVVGMSAENYRKKRVKRNEAIAFLNASEASSAGLSKNIQVYDRNTTTGYKISAKAPYPNVYKPKLELPRVSNERKSGHISEISTYRADGARYVYGIAAYNFEQHDVTFAISGGSPDCKTGLVYYNHGQDNSVNNKKGQDEYYDRTIMPAYAHSYMLTAVLSPDYVDIKNDGMTDDDLGGYTKINYSRALKDENGNAADPSNYTYQWRVPFEKNTANYNEGFKSIGNNETYGDDKASYVYGKKELWYIHSIETKTHVAEFYVSDRQDGLGVESEAGGKGNGSNKMKKLDKIVLYHKEDKVKNGDKAVPIKVIHFEYNYSLCKNIGNNKGDNIDKNGDPVASNSPDNINAGKGKLTLKRVYFTYGTSEKSSLSDYRFNYSDFNPDYNLKGYDRWGNFKDNSTASTSCDNINGQANTSEFPYVDQDAFTGGANNGKKKADVYASAWALSAIQLPSGGTINVNYEADDYAFVQDKRAMEMAKIVGVVHPLDKSTIHNLSDLSYFLYTGSTKRTCLVFKLANEVTFANSDEVRRRYFYEKDGTPIKDLFFRFMVNLKAGNYEYVSGYAQPEDCGLMPNLIGGAQYGYVTVAVTPDNDHPVARASWDFMKLHLPRLAYNQPTMNDNGILQVVKALGAMVTSISQTITGFYNSMWIAGNGAKFVPSKSFIRLYNPTHFKKGGGSRVKRVTLNDNWEALTGNAAHKNFVYGQEYDYTTIDEYGNKISSGVASYEPVLGGEENPFRQPVYFSSKNLLVPDDDSYQETPYGESYFPSPGVGYSKVSIKNINASPSAPSGVHGTGKTVKEFYTARDFPTITRQTRLWTKRFKPNAILRLLKTYSTDNMAASQGYVVELNDMHGKPKAEAVYAENKDEAISGVEYKYKQVSPKRLNNTAMTMNKDKTIEENMVGVECDMTVDFRQSKTSSNSGGIGGNLDAFLAFILPVAIPVVLPTYAYEGVSFKSATVTKVINRYGILEKTIAYDLGSKVATENVMLDAETGDVLLTKTVNAFNDNLYNFKYPAHWAYEAMGQAYKNIGFEQYAPINLAATFNNEDLFVPGDEVLYTYSNGTYKNQTAIANVVNTASGKRLIQKGGYPVDINSVTYVKVIRSGRRNQQTVTVGEVTTFENPLVFNNQTNKYDLSFTKVLNASATEYGEGWPFFCECEIKPGRIYNPYTLAFSGIWRQKKTWAFLTNRTQTRFNDNTNLRRDGAYESFTPFWNYSGISWGPSSDARWQFVTNVTAYSPQGFELENKDPLDRYSSALYGYKDMLPVAVAANARYQEIAFDGFEDYSYQRCEEDHFNYKKPVAEIPDDVKVSEKNSHTGKRSLRVGATKNAQIQKKITIKGTCVTPVIGVICPEE